MSEKKTYFISDLHLGATYLKSPVDYERRVVRFLNSIADSADRLYLLGDILDYWYEYRTVVPRGFTRFFGALASLADRGVEITWFIGNHDIWIFDYLSSEIGLRVVDGYEIAEIHGKKFFMSHGDGLGKLPPMFRFIRATFRNPICQKLYSAIHPRWTVGFAHRWSSHSRLNGQDASETLQADDPLLRFAAQYRKEHPDTEYFVFGHRHVLVEKTLGPDCRLVILGEGFRLMTYGVFDGESFNIHKIK